VCTVIPGFSFQTLLSVFYVSVYIKVETYSYCYHANNDANNESDEQCKNLRETQLGNVF